jgi:hypothetical protein
MSASLAGLSIHEGELASADHALSLCSAALPLGYEVAANQD